MMRRLIVAYAIIALIASGVCISQISNGMWYLIPYGIALIVFISYCANEIRQEDQLSDDTYYDNDNDLI